jgi:hypothetical protein
LFFCTIAALVGTTTAIQAATQQNALIVAASNREPALGLSQVNCNRWVLGLNEAALWRLKRLATEDALIEEPI